MCGKLGASNRDSASSVEIMQCNVVRQGRVKSEEELERDAGVT